MASDYFADLVNGSSSASAALNKTATSSAEQSYTTFLTLLTTQLQHQDPLNPTATDTFTSQMIQLSTVEQQLKTNTMLESIMGDLTSLSSSNGLGYVGKTITATGDTNALVDGEAKWRYALAGNAEKTTIQIKDSDGKVVYETTGETTAGIHDFTWDGTKTDGSAAPAGNYTIAVSSYSGSGAAIGVGTQIVGKVTGVDNTGSTSALLIGNILVDMNTVVNIKT